MPTFLEDVKVPASQQSSQKKGPEKFEHYINAGGGLSNKNLKYALWFTENKLLLYRLLLGFIGFWCVLFWGYTLFNVGDYLIFGLRADQNLAREMSYFPNYTLINTRLSPELPKIISTQALPSGTDKYDLVAEVANTNERFLVTFDYYFNLNNGKSEKQHGFLLPGENKFLTLLGVKNADFSGGDVQISFDNFVWKRVNAHEIKNTTQWQSERLNFTTDNFALIRTTNPDSGAHADRVTFKLTNNSPYSFKAPFFYIALYFQQSLVGILPLELTSFGSLETKAIDVRVFTPNINVSDVVVYPLINVYDSEEYVKATASS